MKHDMTRSRTYEDSEASADSEGPVSPATRHKLKIAKCIMERGPCTHVIVAGYCKQHRTTVTAWLAKMAADGIVEQRYKYGKTGRPAKEYVLTEDGAKWAATKM